MKLRIIDGRDDHELSAKDDTIPITLVLEGSEDKLMFKIDSYISPASRNFRESLLAYYLEHRIRACRSSGAAMGEKILKCGSYIGDQLLGEDLQLLKFVDIMEEEGLSNIEVSIESNALDFFSEPWESVILHEQNYVLATAVKSFERKIVDFSDLARFPSRNYRLSYPSFEHTENLSTKELSKNVELGLNDTLRILNWVSRPNDFRLPFAESVSAISYLNLASNGIAVEHVMCNAKTINEFSALFSVGKRVFHALHYDGPVVFDGNTIHFVITDGSGNGTLFPLEKIADMLRENDITLVTLDSRAYDYRNQSLIEMSAASLVSICMKFHQHGVGNVVGLNAVTDPWTSTNCFSQFYTKLTQGFAIAQAVVETRKSLQTEIATRNASSISGALHSWTLLVHYGAQSVIFFQSDHAQLDAAKRRFSDVLQARLQGFQRKYLPPKKTFISDKKLTDVAQKVVTNSSGEGVILSVRGEEGIGKTHFSHLICCYLVYSHQIDYGFYYDFSRYLYSNEDIFDMLSEFVNKTHEEYVDAKKTLSRFRCIFVFDNIDTIYTSNPDIYENLFESFKGDGHIVMLVHKNEISSRCSSVLEVPPLSRNEMQELVIERVGNSDLNKTVSMDLLFDTLGGHPWLLEQSIRLMEKSTPEALLSEIAENVPAGSHVSKVESFYQWQWRSLPHASQNLLLLLSRHENLFLEMLQVVMDQKERKFEPAQRLFMAIGASDNKFTQMLDAWEQSGLVERTSLGRTIDHRCYSFLEKKYAELIDLADREAIDFYIAQVICEGIAVLSQHLIKDPNVPIVNNLIYNRQNWAKTMETLWFGKDYEGFFRTKSALDTLLAQVGLQHESSAWARDVIKRTQLPTDIDIGEDSSRFLLSWLTLITQSITNNSNDSDETIVTGARFWETWVSHFTGDKAQFSLFQAATEFLIRYHISCHDWRDCIAICDKRLLLYIDKEAWYKVILTYKTLMQSYTALGQYEQVLFYEEKILHEIPYNDAPPGFELQQSIDVLTMRVSRGATKNARHLLNAVKKRGVDMQFEQIIEELENEILYQEGNYMKVLPFYCRIWKAALASQHNAALESLKTRLIAIEDNIGRENFRRHADKVWEPEIPHPRDIDLAGA